MEGRISPVSSADGEDLEEINRLLREIVEDEVDINIHFHCEHCIKLDKCKTKPKPGWSCEIIKCPHSCGMKFHACKLEEHNLLCSHLSVPCINAGNGCSLQMERHCISDHLPHCPASVVICTHERNRWLAGIKSRELVAPPDGSMRFFDPKDLDVSLALHDQGLTNELQNNSERVMQFHKRTRKLPILPLHSDTTSDSHAMKHFRICADSSPQEEDLTPGLSGSISTMLDKSSQGVPSKRCDYCYNICVHGLHKSICRFCRHTKPPPDKITKKVWRQIHARNELGKVTPEWKRCEVVSEVRRETNNLCRHYDFVLHDPEYDSKISFNRLEYLHSPSLDPLSLKLELPVENYSKSQAKPYNMITIQCLQLMRRSEYSDHVRTAHCDIMSNGIEGQMLLRRCPMMAQGCPYSAVVMEADSVCPQVQCDSKSGAFCLTTPAKKMTSSEQIDDRNYASEQDENISCTDFRLTDFPLEVLIHIVSFLDGFSLGKAALTCWQLNVACVSMVREKGIVYQNWTRNEEGSGWHVGDKKWKFSNSFGCVESWRFRDNFTSDVSNHLGNCQYSERVTNKDKFSYGKVSPEFLRKFRSTD